jgi:hypothetical protein
VSDIRIYLELGAKKVFACALDWPGWCRSGRDEPGALGALADYRERLAPVTERAGFPLPLSSAGGFEVVERLVGNATTDFGAPAMVPAADRAPLSEEQCRRLAALVLAAWDTLDDVVSGAPAVLAKGPRGGGRDRDAVAAHVLTAEVAYARKLGIRHPAPAVSDAAAIKDLRRAIVASLFVPDLEPARGSWPSAYAARRIAWHVLDHAWEIQDKS